MGCCKFFKKKVELIGFIFSERGGGTGEDKEVLRGPEAPVHLEDPEELGQLPAPDGGVGEVPGGSDDASGSPPGKDETRIETDRQRTENCDWANSGCN